MSFEEAQYSAQPFHLVVQPHGVFEKLFALVGHEIDQRIDAERQHPIARQPIQQGADSKYDRACSQHRLDNEDAGQSGKADRMLEHRGQSATVDLLFPREVRFEDQPVAEQRAWREFFDEALTRLPHLCIRWLSQEPRCQAGSSMIRNGGVDQMQQRVRSYQIQVVSVEMRRERNQSVFEESETMRAEHVRDVRI